MRKLLLALALSVSFGGPALAVDSTTLVGNVAYSMTNTDVRVVPSVALTANRVWTLPYAAGTGIGQTANLGAALIILDPQGNIGGSNSCIVITPQSGDTINNSASAVTFCTTFGRATLFPVTGNNWSLSLELTGPGQSPATRTNDNATAGNVGEVISATVLTGAAVSLTTNTPANITSVSLTAGDWDCRATISRNLGGATSVTTLSGAINATTATIGTQGTDAVTFLTTAANVMGATGTDTKIGPTRISLAATTSEFLNVNDVFTVSTDAAYGTLTCRRAR
jgi:hypothetical protein